MDDRPADGPPAPARRTRVRVLVGVAVVLLVVLGAGLWWFFGGDPPPEVDIDDAARGVTTTTGADRPGTTVAGDLSGTWTVVTDAGTSGDAAEGGSFAGFRIREELAGIGGAEAVGRTPGVSGTFDLDGTTVTAADVDVDLTTITTDRPMRDGRVQQALETSRFPRATFRLAEPITLGPRAGDGTTVDVTATGDLTIHGVTRRVAVPLQARLVDDTVVVVGSLDVTFADFGVQVPSSPAVVSVEDHGTVELQLLLTR